MPSQTRGSIEESAVVFSNFETEKTISFEAASFQNKNFPSPPVVKLISISTVNSLKSSEKNTLILEDGTLTNLYSNTGGTNVYEPDDSSTYPDESAIFEVSNIFTPAI